MPDYLTEKDFYTGKVVSIRAVKKESIDGWPTLVIYFHGEKRGLPLTKEIADMLTEALGHNPYVDEFFKAEKVRH